MALVEALLGDGRGDGGRDGGVTGELDFVPLVEAADVEELGIAAALWQRPPQDLKCRNRMNFFGRRSRSRSRSRSRTIDVLVDVLVLLVFHLQPALLAPVGELRLRRGGQESHFFFALLLRFALEERGRERLSVAL